MTRHRSYDDWATRMSEFHPGDRVVYRPHGDEGVVTSKNDRYVFVKFNYGPTHGISCHPDDLDILP